MGVDPNNAIYESDETNNTFTQSTDVKTGIDLVVRKDDSPADPPGVQVVTDGFDPIATRGTETYVITVDNVGTQDATNIRLRDTLPDDAQFLSAIADPTHGFTCSQDGSSTGGVVECVGGRLRGTESEFYDPAGPAGPGPGDDIATVKIKVFARHTVGSMHNEVRVDPLNEIAEANELNNIATQDTTVTNGGVSLNAYNELKIKKEQTSPVDGSGPIAVATNGVITYTITVWDDATDPVGQSAPVVVKDTLPQGFRYIEAKDSAPGPDGFQCAQGSNVQEVTCTAGGPLSGLVNAISGVPVTRTITVKAFAAGTPSGGAVVYTNQADVDPNNAIAEGDEFNNHASVNTDVAVGGANMFNELLISKTQTAPSNNTVATSSVVTYTIVVTNTGTDPAFDVKVKDTLPAGFAYIDARDTAPISDAHSFVCSTAAGNVVNCGGATLSGTVNAATGEPTSRTIVVKAFSSATPGSYTNTAIVDPQNTIAEGNETNNTAQVTTKVVVGSGFIDLKIKKCDDPSCTHGVPAQVDVMGDLTYYVEARNDGTDPAFNVTIRDTLPAGVTFVSATDATGGDGSFVCTYAGGVVTCTGGTLDGTDNLIPGPPTDVPNVRNVQIKVKAPNANGPVSNQIFIDPDNAIPESNETNNSATETTNVLSFVNLKLNKQGPDNAQQNNQEDYTITIQNVATSGTTGRAVDNVHVLDTLPVGLIPLSWSAEGNFVCQTFENPVNTVDCVGDMNPGDTFKITIHVFITQDGGSLDNEACIDPGNLFVESDESDNCATKTTVIKKFSPNLSVQKSASPGTVTPGQTLTYLITVSNIGDAGAASPVTLSDALPSTVTLVGTPVATNGFTCSGTTTITCTDSGSGLPVGGSTTISIQTTVNSGVTLPITNSASVPAATFDSASSPCSSDASKCENETAANQGNNSATVSTSVSGSAGIDLVMVSDDKFDSPDPVVTGSKLTYTIVVANTGTASTTTDPAPNLVVIRTTLPAGLNLDSAAASEGFLCTPSGATTGPVGNVDCSGILAGGASSIATTVTAAAGTSLSVTAKVDPNNDILESNEGNNSQTAITTVVAAPCTGCIDLAMGTIFASPNPVVNGNDITYNFNVTNVGDQSTTVDPAPNAVVVRINLDTSFNESTAVSASAPGFTCVITPRAPGETDPEIECTNATGLAGGAGTLFSVVAHANTASTPSYVDFDVSVDPDLQIAEFNEANNDGSLRVDTVAP